MTYKVGILQHHFIQVGMFLFAARQNLDKSEFLNNSTNVTWLDNHLTVCQININADPDPIQCPFITTSSLEVGYILS
jgi:hypothetical protein